LNLEHKAFEPSTIFHLPLTLFIQMPLTKEQIAQRIARELHDGYYVNLGIGIPTLVANYIPEGMQVILQSEN
jgi:acyl CoA:acetate/3-ketoacid CoA transferase beta subunit